MDTLFSFLAQFFDRLGLWVSIQPNELALRIRSIPLRQQQVSDHTPGVVWKLPFFDRIIKEVVKRRTVDLTNITVETVDRKPYIISLTLTYYVHNLRKALLDCEHFDTSLCVDAQRIVAHWANGTISDYVNVDKLEAACYDKIRASGFRWGCTIEEVGVNSISQHRVYRLMVDNQ